MMKASDFTLIVFVWTKLFVLFKLSHCFDLNVGLKKTLNQNEAVREKNSSSPDDKSLPVSLRVERAGAEIYCACKL